MQNPQPKLTLRINIQISQQYQAGALQLIEEMELSPRNFLEMCSVLAKFQELTDRIKREES